MQAAAAEVPDNVRIATPSVKVILYNYAHRPLVAYPGDRYSRVRIMIKPSARKRNPPTPPDEGPRVARRQVALDFGPLPDALGYALRRAQLQIFAGFHAAFDKFEIRPAQFSVLIVIGRNPGVTATAIGKALAIKPANLVPMLGDFETRGLLRREVNIGDRRSQGLYLTAEGRRFAQKLERRQRALELTIERRYGAAERRALIVMLRRLVKQTRATAPE